MSEKLTMHEAGERWWSAARSGELQFPRCSACGAWGWPPPQLCDACGGLSWCMVDVPGTGTVAAATTVHRGVSPAFAGETPYRVGAVDLDDGPVFITRLGEGVESGSPVRLRWRDEPGDGWPWAELAAGMA